MKCKNPGKCLQPAPASVFCFAQAKGLRWTMRAFRIVVGIKATTAQLVDLYVNACLRWWLFNIVNAFGLKDVGFIRLLNLSAYWLLTIGYQHHSLRCILIPCAISQNSQTPLLYLSILFNQRSASSFESKCSYTSEACNKFPTETQTFLSGRYHVLWQRTTSAS